ncbi:MAG: hypothetical protein HQL02_11730 [Nitrospirae bacterium]|nr:hypothetical protein [Nitrospirota bacterium]
MREDNNQDEALALPPASVPVKRKKRRGKLKGAQRVLESMACDPIAGMAAIANDPDVDVSLRAKLLMELAQYVYPKRKNDQTEEGQVTETYEERLKRIRALADENIRRSVLERQGRFNDERD